jgi:hypothetical protein
VFGIGSAGDAAISPFVQRCQAEYATRTSHEGLGGNRQEVPARLPVGPPAEALQSGAQKRRSVIPPHQGQVVTVDVHQAVVVDRCGDGDDQRRLAHGMVEMDPVNLVAGSVGAAPVIRENANRASALCCNRHRRAGHRRSPHAGEPSGGAGARKSAGHRPAPPATGVLPGLHLRVLDVR